MLTLKRHMRISNKMDFSIELVSMMFTVLEDTSATISWILTSNKLGLLIKLCFWVLCTALYSQWLWGSFPEAKPASGQSSNLLWKRPNPAN